MEYVTDCQTKYEKLELFYIFQIFSFQIYEFIVVA